jgi:hypothetical protein
MADIQNTLGKEWLLLQEEHIWKGKGKWREPHKIIFSSGNIKGGRR